jgi:hypothetical protein
MNEAPGSWLCRVSTDPKLIRFFWKTIDCLPECCTKSHSNTRLFCVQNLNSLSVWKLESTIWKPVIELPPKSKPPTWIFKVGLVIKWPELRLVQTICHWIIWKPDIEMVQVLYQRVIKICDEMVCAIMIITRPQFENCFQFWMVPLSLTVSFLNIKIPA